MIVNFAEVPTHKTAGSDDVRSFICDGTMADEKRCQIYCKTLGYRTARCRDYNDLQRCVCLN
jgi:hypothetical protein